MISLFEDNIPVNIPGITVPPNAGSNASFAYVGIKPDNVTARQASEAFDRLQPFMPILQGKAVGELMRGEEKQFFRDKMVELAQLVDSMPVTYSQQNETDPIAYLHYFFGGSDWYIVEKDMEGEVDQAWGFACLNGDMMNAEYGFISIDELVSLVIRGFMTIDLDFHFDPTPMSVVKPSLGERHGYQA